MRPKVFIASASEGLSVAYDLQELLQKDAHVVIWDQGTFEASEYALTNILQSLNFFDYGIFLFTPDDKIEVRGEKHLSPRDNVIFELGLFIGKLGVKSNFIVMPDTLNLKIPTDLSGLTVLTFESDHYNQQSALGPVVNQIRKSIKSFAITLNSRKSELEEYLKSKFEKYEIPHKLFKQIICENQGALAQFSFLASKKHKSLKEEVKKKNIRNFIKAERLRNELDLFLNTGIENACKTNFNLILEYFSSRDTKFKPRVCLKGHHEFEVEEDGLVVKKKCIGSLFRDRRINYDSIYYPIDSNTGFREVFHSGLSYICNDIPSKSISYEYENPRLDTEKIKVFDSSLERMNRIRTESTEDIEWIDCWVRKIDGGKIIKPKPDECYKSTLVIPLTLYNNKLDPDFKHHFRIDAIPERSIYGYLCFDHHYANYFKDDIDVSVGYVFADILSLYLITALTYREYSDSYYKTVSTTIL